MSSWQKSIIATMTENGYYFVGEFPEIGEIHFDHYPEDREQPIVRCVFRSWEDERLMRYVG